MRGGGEGGVDLGGVAVVIVQRHVVGDVIVELRRAGLGGFGGIGHGRQRIDIDFDRFGGIAGLRHCFGDDEGDGIADIAHLVGHQRGAVGLQQRRAVAALQRQAAGEGSVIGGGEIGSGPDPEHAGHRPGGRGVDAADDAVGMAGTHHPGVGLAGQVEIVGVFALAAHQRVVFLAADRLSDAEFLQCDSVFEGRRGRLVLH